MASWFLWFDSLDYCLIFFQTLVRFFCRGTSLSLLISFQHSHSIWIFEVFFSFCFLFLSPSACCFYCTGIRVRHPHDQIAGCIISSQSRWSSFYSFLKERWSSLCRMVAEFERMYVPSLARGVLMVAKQVSGCSVPGVPSVLAPHKRSVSGLPKGYSHYSRCP